MGFRVRGGLGAPGALSVGAWARGTPPRAVPRELGLRVPDAWGACPGGLARGRLRAAGRRSAWSREDVGYGRVRAAGGMLEVRELAE